MLGDILLITEKHKNAASQIGDICLKLKKKKLTIAIGGESGSGKSEVAHMISRYLKERGILAKILHTDDYYLLPPLERREWRKKEGIKYIGLSEYDWALINNTISNFKRNEKSIMPCIDLLTDQVDQLHTNFKGIDILILEGLFSVNADVDIRVFIDLTYHETKKAQVLRGKEPQTIFRLKVLEREHEIVQNLKQLANLIITKEFNVINLMK
ncbi:MAG: uridine kinase family protein [Promethearchaeota archaeon]